MTSRYASSRLTVSAVLSMATVLVVVTAVARSVGSIERHPPRVLWIFAAFFVAIAIGECLRVWLPGDRNAAPIGTAAAFAFALLPADSGRGLGEVGFGEYGAATVIVVVSAATLVGIGPHLLSGRYVDRDSVAHRLISTALLAVVFRDLPLVAGGPLATVLDPAGGRRWAVALVMMAAVLLALLFDALLASALKAARDHSRLGATLRDELRTLAGMGSAIGSTGILIALAMRPMGLLALPVFLAPLLLTQFAFRRFATVRATYSQTIRSLSRVTELGGYTETGHSVRVAELAMAMGRDLGLSERDVRDLEYAALLHDIGQLSLTEAIPGGATLMAAPREQQRIASLGAEVVRQAGVLDKVAVIVEHQSAHYRRPHERSDAEVPLASRIIKVANAFDDLVGDSLEGGRRANALERIHLGLAYEYDPRVVTALSRVMSRG